MAEYWVAILLLAGVFALLGYAPPIYDAEGNYLGESFRIFFIHVPAAWTSFVTFFGCFVFSGIYLIKRKPGYDVIAAASAEVGFVFASIVLVTGPIWARAAWGTFWTWEPRLTTMLILWLLYLGYLLLRYSLDPGSRRAVVSSVLGIFAFLDVPLVMFAIHLWGAKSHPTPGVGFFEDPRLAGVVYLNFIAFLTTAAFFVAKRSIVELRR